MGLPANSRAGPSDSAALPRFWVQVLLLILFFARVGVYGDAPRAPEAEHRAHADIFGRVAMGRHQWGWREIRVRGRNLDDGENVIVFWKSRGIFSRGKLARGVRHVLEPRTMLGVDHT